MESFFFFFLAFCFVFPSFHVVLFRISARDCECQWVTRCFCMGKSCSAIRSRGVHPRLSVKVNTRISDFQNAISLFSVLLGGSDSVQCNRQASFTFAGTYSIRSLADQLKWNRSRLGLVSLIFDFASISRIVNSGVTLVGNCYTIRYTSPKESKGE